MANNTPNGNGAPNVLDEEKFEYIDVTEKRAKEGQAKMAILIIIAVLTAGYGAWNIWRMVLAVQGPVVAIRDTMREHIPVPGVVVCGTNINSRFECYKSAFNAADDDHKQGEKCNQYLSRNRINATPFVNMRGFYNETGMFCHILNPRGTAVNKPLVFNNDTQKVALVMWSTDDANNKVGAVTPEQFFHFGLFSENEDPKNVRFQIVRIPSIAYVYFKRTEKYRTTSSDVITGGMGGDNQYHDGATVQLDSKFTSFTIGGFGASSKMWGIMRVIPENYVNDTTRNQQLYPVELWYSRVEFTLLQLTANMGGFVSILSALYLLLFGTRRIAAPGVVQRYILKSAPDEPPVYTSTMMPYDYKSESGEYYDTVNPGGPIFTEPPPQSADPSVNTFDSMTTSRSDGPLISSPRDSPLRRATSTAVDDARMSQMRHELQAQMYQTIATEFTRMQDFLNQYYFPDAFRRPE